MTQMAQAHLDRFIPAGAGNGRMSLNTLPAVTVHPRGCGERMTLQALI